MHLSYILKCVTKRVRIYMRNGKDWSFHGHILVVDEEGGVIGIGISVGSEVEV